ncbi:N-acetyl-gamma-glutamyl-phosphate reductase [soil metagenome]
MPLSVAVAGASGYAGGELLRLLSSHPEFVVTVVTANTNAGQPVSAVHPHLVGYRELVFAETTAEALAGADVVFLALPHGASGAITSQLPDDVLVVDCGADHRLTSAEDWAEFYGGDYHGAWTYGLPELVLDAMGTHQRTILPGVTRLAIPGCNATAVTLALAPGIAGGVVADDDLVAVLAVGTSGAGKSLRPDLLASEVAGSAAAYQVGGVHRHTPEILQNLRVAGATGPTMSFTPVLVPISRGILATSTAKLTPGTTEAQVREAWVAAYADEPFVHVLPAGSFPRSGDTTGANTCLIGLAVDARAGRVVVISAIDNLVKGTAGAAIQSANIALGFPETLGLSVNGVAP